MADIDIRRTDIDVARTDMDAARMDFDDEMIVLRLAFAANNPKRFIIILYNSYLVDHYS